MITLRPGSTLRFRGTWWASKAKTARVDLTGASFAVLASGLPFAATAMKLAQPSGQDFEVYAPHTETAKAKSGTTGWLRLSATFPGGDVIALPDITVTLA